MNISLTIPSQDNLYEAAKEILDKTSENRILLFYGDMGAGKTTLIKALCRVLKVGDTVSSPTFSIVNEYSSPGGPVYHFDFYRIKAETEALDLGLEDYLYSGSYCFIEWPEKIPDLLPDNAFKVTIRAAEDNVRLVEVIC